MRGSPGFRLKYWQELLGEDEVKRLVQQAWDDVHAERQRKRDILRVKHVDPAILAAIVRSGRTGAQSTAAHDMTGRGLGWHQHRK